MGNSSSSLSTSQIEEFTSISKFSPKEIKRLYRRFRRLDRNNDGTLTQEEFLSLPELATNPLRDRVLQLFHLNQRDNITFKTFISTLNVFSSKADKHEKLKAAFAIYDIDGDGVINNIDLTKIVRMLVGQTLSTSQVDQVVIKTMSEADIDGDGVLSFEEFAKTMSSVDLEMKMSIKF
ncbi:hypothetical protein RCL1_002125 [Eukaryota sp. TZLM3-RCL]